MAKKFTPRLRIGLCSKCLYSELNSWLEEKWDKLNLASKQQILGEMEKIHLSNGTCIVCNSKKISLKTPEKIFRILKENKTDAAILSEFENFFIGCTYKTC